MLVFKFQHNVNSGLVKNLKRAGVREHTPQKIILTYLALVRVNEYQRFLLNNFFTLMSYPCDISK